MDKNKLVLVFFHLFYSVLLVVLILLTYITGYTNAILDTYYYKVKQNSYVCRVDNIIWTAEISNFENKTFCILLGKLKEEGFHLIGLIDNKTVDTVNNKTPKDFFFGLMFCNKLFKDYDEITNTTFYNVKNILILRGFVVNGRLFKI
ncbi:MAG: hypothetical protein ABGW69_02150 [Nanoarchaeota archaeon]